MLEVRCRTPSSARSIDLGGMWTRSYLSACSVTRLQLGPSRRSKPGRKRKRAVPSPPDSPSDDRTASSSSSWAFAEARAGKSSTANTPTSRAAVSDAGGFRNDTEEEFHSPGVGGS